MEYKELLEECATERGVYPVQHRSYYEFGWFLQEMVDLLVFGRFSKDEKLNEFQQQIDWNGKDAQDFDTYFELFKEWNEFAYSGYDLSDQVEDSSS